MARRRRFSRAAPRFRRASRSSARLVRRSRGRRSSGRNVDLMKLAMGAGGVVLYEALLEPRIPLSPVVKDILGAAGGVYLSRKGGMLGTVGQGLAWVNATDLARRGVSQFMGGQATSQTQSSGLLF